MRERDFQKPGRSVAISGKAMAATSHPLATLAAIDILRSGGNAVDAAVCAVALQCVIDPLMTGIGGDCFAMIAPKGGAPVAINGSGRAPAAASAAALRARGLSAIDAESPEAVTIPGCIDAWTHIAGGYGRLPLDVILAPAIAAAEQGFCVTPRIAFDWERHQSRVRRHPPALQHYLPAGRPPRTGEIFVQPALASTLRRIAAEGRDGFYRGPVARELAGVLQSVGGAHSEADFAGYRCFETAPISARYRDYDLLECPPNGQGLAALLILRILDGFDFADPTYGEADRIHLLAEATKLAYAMRDSVICDPGSAEADIDAILSEETVAGLRARVDMARAAPSGPWEGPTHKDTVYVTVVDEAGNAVSLINSVFDSFGSGIYAPESGVLLHNRGAGFSLTEGHANELAGGKLPFHTIIPAMLMKDGLAVMSFGVMGAHYQAVGHAHILSQMIDLGLDPQQANEAPRSFCHDGVLTLETTIGEDVRAELEKRGHVVRRAEEPIGGCQAIWIDRERGILLGASDHRKDGVALGL